MTSVSVGCTTPICKQAYVDGLKESRLTIREDEDPVASGEVWTRPDMKSPPPCKSECKLQERSVQCCKRTKEKTYRPLNKHWVILTTSNASSVWAQRDEICCTFTLRRRLDEWFLLKHILETILHQIWTDVQNMTRRTPEKFSKVFDICNPVSNVLKWFEGFRIKIKNASTTSSKSNQKQNINTIRWEARNITTKTGEIKHMNSNCVCRIRCWEYYCQ